MMREMDMTGKKRTAEFEKSVEFFFDTLERLTGKRIPEQEAAEWRDIITEHFFPKDNFIIRVGEVPEYYYLVVRGLTRQYYLDVNGQDVTRGFSWEGEFVCTEVLIQGDDSVFSVETIEASYMLAISISDWTRLKNTDYMKDVQIAALSRNVRRRLDRDAYFLMYSSVGRFKSFSNEYPHLLHRIKQSYLASYLGMTPETLSRIRKSIKEI